MAVILVSNRLPVTVRRSAEGVVLGDSHGGLATGLAGVHGAGDGWWIGWPGRTDTFTPEELASLHTQLRQRRCIPLELDHREFRGFYGGESNGVVWPLFHYLIEQVPLYPRHWADYEQVNLRFAQLIAEHAGRGDEVWIHDYQLMRVPALLRQLRPDLRIGFFLHIPFPAYEVFRVLPARRLLLEGMLGADLIGFHTAGYAEHFAACVTRLLGVAELEKGRFEYDGRTPAAGVFPMGIDVARFEACSGESPFGGDQWRSGDANRRRTLVAIDRLDYTKGIPRRLLAYEQLLRQHPELRERVTLIQVAVPSRTGVRAYRRFRRHLEAMVGRLNGTFGTPAWTPIQYLYQSFTQSQLLALYRSADVMLVTPVRDGLNLVAKEFVASRIDGDGVLVLSEFTGAADELREALPVNPYDVQETAETYHRALVMPRAERRTRMRALRGRVRGHPVQQWADSFLTALRESCDAGPVASGAYSDAVDVREAAARLRSVAPLTLLMDYDGTLAPFVATPDLAAPDDELLELLRALVGRPRTTVHIVSGRQREILDSWFGGLGVGLHAEHGSWSRDPGDAEWQRFETVHPVPYDALLGVLKIYTDRTPGALIERKSAGLAWHFRLVRKEVGPARADALVEEIRRRFPPDTVEILRGEQVVEFRPSGIHKGLIVARVRRGVPSSGRIVAIGDDTTDEDLFAALGPGDISIHVGPRPSGAALRLRNVTACREFLRSLVDSQQLVP